RAARRRLVPLRPALVRGGPLERTPALGREDLPLLPAALVGGAGRQGRALHHGPAAAPVLLHGHRGRAAGRGSGQPQRAAHVELSRRRRRAVLEGLRGPRVRPPARPGGAAGAGRRDAPPGARAARRSGRRARPLRRALRGLDARSLRRLLAFLERADASGAGDPAHAPAGAGRQPLHLRRSVVDRPGMGPGRAADRRTHAAGEVRASPAGMALRRRLPRSLAERSVDDVRPAAAHRSARRGPPYENLEPNREMRMKKIATFVLATGVLVAPSFAQDPPNHIMLTAEDIKWSPAPASLPPGALWSVSLGDPGREGLHVIHFKFPAGYIIPPHFHPVDENIIVLSGTYAMGMGQHFDVGALKSLPAGSFEVMPRGQAHFVMAKTETIIVRPTVGVWGVSYVDPKDDHRNKKCRVLPAADCGG